MKNLAFLLVPVVFTAYALNKWVIKDESNQWVVYFLADHMVSVITGVLLIWAFYTMGMKIHTLAAGWFLLLAIFNLVSEALGDRSIGKISEPIWVGLTLAAMIHLAWKQLKIKNNTQE